MINIQSMNDLVHLPEKSGFRKLAKSYLNRSFNALKTSALDKEFSPEADALMRQAIRIQAYAKVALGEDIRVAGVIKDGEGRNLGHTGVVTVSVGSDTEEIPFAKTEKPILGEDDPSFMEIADTLELTSEKRKVLEELKEVSGFVLELLEHEAEAKTENEEIREKGPAAAGCIHALALSLLLNEAKSAAESDEDSDDEETVSESPIGIAEKTSPATELTERSSPLSIEEKDEERFVSATDRFLSHTEAKMRNAVLKRINKLFVRCLTASVVKTPATKED